MATHKHDDHSDHAHDHNPPQASAHATLHYLIGCFIGDVIGVGLGVSFGLGTPMTIGLGIVLTYIFGFAFALQPLMKSMDLALSEAMRVVWVGEAISIATIEVAMNGVDYWIGGVQTTSMMTPVFWIGRGFAAPAGFLAAWPVNYWLLKTEIKTHH